MYDAVDNDNSGLEGDQREARTTKNCSRTTLAYLIRIRIRLMASVRVEVGVRSP